MLKMRKVKNNGKEVHLGLQTCPPPDPSGVNQLKDKEYISTVVAEFNSLPCKLWVFEPTSLVEVEQVDKSASSFF